MYSWLGSGCDMMYSPRVLQFIIPLKFLLLVIYDALFMQYYILFSWYYFCDIFHQYRIHFILLQFYSTNYIVLVDFFICSGTYDIWFSRQIYRSLPVLCMAPKTPVFVITVRYNTMYIIKFYILSSISVLTLWFISTLFFHYLMYLNIACHIEYTVIHYSPYGCFVLGI